MIVVTERRCAVSDCRKPLTRKPGEREHRWQARDYCDRNCYLALRVAGSKPSTAATNAPVGKVCLECGTPFRRHKGERLGRWLDRQCCDEPCAQRRARRLGPAPKSAPKSAPQRARAPKPEPRPSVAAPADPGGELRRCLLASCRKELVRRAGEEPHKFRGRRFCSGHQCAMRWVHTQHRDGQPQQKTCPGCRTVFGWPVGMPPAQWKRKTYCGPGVCGANAAPTGKTRRAAKPKPVTPTSVTAPDPVVRPDPAALVPDPAVVDMDRRRRVALRMLDEGAFPERIAVELGVSLAQVRRWDDGVAS